MARRQLNALQDAPGSSLGLDRAFRTVPTRPRITMPDKNRLRRPESERRLRQATRFARVLRVLEMIQGRGRYDINDLARDLECSTRGKFKGDGESLSTAHGTATQTRHRARCHGLDSTMQRRREAWLENMNT
jgi:hypothetical protein